ncbi:hypothetical protein Tamer19_56500 [Cupriavidus sp. TA19]|nr:hypothetical protein Tamer19_56500 [Cupriavidus sp. TA19]
MRANSGASRRPSGICTRPVEVTTGDAAGAGVVADALADALAGSARAAPGVPAAPTATGRPTATAASMQASGARSLAAARLRREETAPDKLGATGKSANDMGRNPFGFIESWGGWQ